MPIKKKEKPKIDKKKLEKLVKDDPTSERWNNTNSRKNLRQYRDKPVIPEIVLSGETVEIEIQKQVDAITKGRKGLDPSLIKKLIPKRTVLTPAEKERYTGIVTTFLSDFKNEEPTASDIDDIFEIAKCDTMETRLLEASKNDPATLVAISQAMDRIYKRKQTAKENLASRRVDRKDARSSQDTNIVDLVVAFDRHNSKMEQERIDALLAEETIAGKDLRDIIEKEEF